MDNEALFAKHPKLLAAFKQLEAEKKQKAAEADARMRRYESLTSKAVPVVGGLFAVAVLAALLSKPRAA